MRRREDGGHARLWIDQEQNRGVIHRIRATAIVMNLYGHAQVVSELIKFGLFTCYTNELRIKEVHIARQLGGSVAFRIDRDKHDLRMLCAGQILQRLVHLRERGQCGRTNVRAVGVAEKQDGPMPFQSV